MNSNPEITFGTRIRKSPFFDSTIKWWAKGFTIYNNMYMPTYYASYEEDYWSLVCERLVGFNVTNKMGETLP